ncbi:hypothetical protein TCDM_12349 [Trypanosoma cruzi Dm28c]|uniref:Uncharacterized protein n=1 Tax=Trypanosoma cruzi Dm28c TaxID=1416333 RepID=V5B3D4_TRYCR|nr:hypothetical protein TCDM_12349 [Trypanosoma cruzi Dm28c]
MHSEWHHHPRRTHSQQQQLTHTDTRKETEEQCTGNTQRLPPAAAGATAGVLFLTRRHTPSSAHAKTQPAECKKAQPPLAASNTRFRRPFCFCLLQRRRTSPRTAGGCFVAKSTAAVPRRQLQLLEESH